MLILYGLHCILGLITVVPHIANFKCTKAPYQTSAGTVVCVDLSEQFTDHVKADRNMP